MADDDDIEYCDCADELKRHLRVEAASDGQFPETSGWASIFSTGTKPPTKRKSTKCGPNCGPNIEELGTCGLVQDGRSTGQDGRYGARQDGYGTGQCGHGTGQESGYGGEHGQGRFIAGAGGGAFGAGRGAIGAGGRVVGDAIGAGGGVVGGAERRTASDVLFPLVGGGLVFLGLMVFLHKYFDAGTVVRKKSKELFKQVFNLMCDPKAGKLISALGASSGVGAGPGGSTGPTACSEEFAVETQRSRKKKPDCGKERIHPDRRRHPLPPTRFSFPVIPGLHDCNDDEDYEEGVFVAPGPFG